MMPCTSLLKSIENTPLELWQQTLPPLLDDIKLTVFTDKNFIKWQKIVQQLPPIKASPVTIQSGIVTIGVCHDCDSEVRQQIASLLHGLHPWRKGPYSLFGITIDTEWRSDFKWDRLSGEIQPLTGRLVLDVGCGNGYHCWRMVEEGAGMVIGIDPYILYRMQFQAIQHFTDQKKIYFIPCSFESLPKVSNAFDSIFSMGILYHRRSPLEHIGQLHSFLRRGGELILETLIIEGGPNDFLVPEGRYGKMKNVWTIPSCALVEHFLDLTGFTDVRLIHVGRTTTREQRSTEWMTFESLADFLDEKNEALTVEGYPAPTRAIFLATKS